MIGQGSGSFDTKLLTTTFHPLVRDAGAVLFDVGGTLAHPDWERICVLALHETGRAFLASELRHSFCETLGAIDQRLAKGTVDATHTERPGWMFSDLFSTLGVDEQRCEQIRSRINAAHGQKHIWCGLDETVPGVVDDLRKASIKVGVISNTEDGRLEELLALTDMTKRLDVIVDSQIVGLRKPDAAIFRYAVERLGIEPHEAVFVGDSYRHDVLGAERAGLRAILLDPLDIHSAYDCERILTLSELTGARRC